MRPRMTDEERRAAIKTKNQRYYRSHKDKWYKSPRVKCCVYAITGLPDSKAYVGITKSLSSRLAAHKRVFGDDVLFTALMTFDVEIPRSEINVFENIALMYHGGKSGCINVVNCSYCLPARDARSIVEKYLGHVDTDGKAFLRKCFESQPEWSSLLALFLESSTDERGRRPQGKVPTIDISSISISNDGDRQP